MSKKIIKVTSLFISVCLLFSCFAGASFYTDSNANYFKFVTGYEDGTFRPGQAVSRAECAKMLSFVFKSDDKNENVSVFYDLSSDHWAYDSITTLVSNGVFGGFSDGSFKPDKPMTRAEFCAVIARILDEKGEGSAAFNDTANHWAKNDINALYSKNIVGGYPDGSFKPNNFISRAEAVVAINRITGNNTTNKSSSLFYDVSESHWAYNDIMSAASTSALESELSHPDFTFNDVEYIEIDTNAIKKELDTLLKEFQVSDATRQGEIFNKISKIEADVALAISMSGINVKRNVISEKDQNNTNNAYSAGNIIKDAKRTRYKLISNVNDKAVFESVIGMKIEEIPIPEIVLPEKLVALYTEEQEYENEFNEFMYGNSIIFNGQKYSLAQAEQSANPKLVDIALNHYVDNEEKYGEIFTNLIDVRTRIAHYFGYRYFTDIGYLMSGKTFSPKDVETIRADVKKYIAPLFYKLSVARAGINNGYYAVGNINIENKATYIDDIKNYLKEMSPQTREALDYLVDSDLTDTETRENKAQVSFTSYIDSFESPFLFINQTEKYSDIQEFAHEFGHAFHAFRIGKDGVAASSDICELASYGMEMLIMHNYESFFDDNFVGVVYSDFYEKLALMLLTTFMDDFQYQVYKDPFLTAKERNTLYAKLYKEYFIGTVYTHEAKERGICWTNPTHLFTVPYYSIDYTLALTVAFQLWEIGNKEGFDKEFETYMEMLETPFIDYNISYVAVGAGLTSPFKKGIIKKLADNLDAMFKIK